jgi:membrane protease YdiL (CAAX protease family)
MTSEPDSEFHGSAEPGAQGQPATPAPDVREPQPEEPSPTPVLLTEARRTGSRFEKLQLTWRVLLYLLLTLVILPPAVFSLATNVFGRQRGGLSPEFLLFMEVMNFALIAALTMVFALMEGVPWGSYGLPWKQAFHANFWVGMLLGLAEASVLIGLIELFGGFSLEGWALRGSAIASWALFHFLLFVTVGLYEEFLFRGYPQAALSKLIGFWPAAFALSLGFGLVHLNNRGENWVGAASVALVGLLFAFTLKRTGNLWYAVGLHAGFDWAESFLYSVPDSGELLRGHLWNTSLHGPDWLTGGSVGPEASVFCFLTMLLQFLVVLWLFPAKKVEPVHESPARSEAEPL